MPTDTLTAKGRQTPVNARASVDLPEPDGPTTATVWPAGMANETSRRAQKSSVARRDSRWRMAAMRVGSACVRRA